MVPGGRRADGAAPFYGTSAPTPTPGGDGAPPSRACPQMTDTDVLIVGGGPAGLAAALALRRRGVARVLLVDREADAGGIPRHSDHIGFGVRDLHRLLSGPQYAARYVRLAQDAGVEIRTGATVTDWAGPRALSITSAAGLDEIHARPCCSRPAAGNDPDPLASCPARGHSAY
jgi:NADPH-dependent 2,4-dienoyl-CoA reductase/sulfur reductase-like enzyme